MEFVNEMGNEEGNNQRLVAQLAAEGVEATEIAAVLGFKSEKALRRAYGKALDRGLVEANHAVARKLFELATKGKNVTAMMFWLKCRAKWNMNPASDWMDEDVDVVFGTCERIED
jgi:hypothetical protein